MTAVGECVVAELFKRQREKLTVTLRTQDGALRCDIRVFVVASAGRWRPTKHGITVESARLTELIAALQLAQTEAAKAEGNGRSEATQATAR